MKSNEELINSSLSKIESWVEQGCTDKEIAEKIGVSYSSFRRYKSQNSALKEAIAQGKNKKNELVEQALFKCCTGYTYYEEVVTKVKEEVMAEDGQTVLAKEDVKISKVKKYKGPDLAAQKFYLVNRKKAHWMEDPNKVSIDKKNLKLKEKAINNSLLSL